MSVNEMIRELKIRCKIRWMIFKNIILRKESTGSVHTVPVMWRRFNPLKEDMSAFVRLKKKKGLTNEDLEIILAHIEFAKGYKPKA